MVGGEWAISQRLQLVLELSPLEAGLTIWPIPIAAFIGGPVAGWALPRVGLRKLLSATLLLPVIGLTLILLTRDSGGLWEVFGMAALGFGIGASMAAASSAIMSRASAERAGMAASIEEVSYELGGVMGITITGTILTAVYSASLILPRELAGMSGVRDSLDAALLMSEKLGPDSANLLLNLARNSFDNAFVAVLTMTALMLAVLAAVLRPNAKLADQLQ